jgi:CheY-like chemotaxis protein
MIASSLQDRRVFLIEDNVSNRVIMQMLLEQQGAQVGFERWGIKTIQRLKAFAPVDVICLDLMFPRGVSGFDIYDEIRTQADFDRVPIVAVSASESAVVLPKAREKGFHGFIPKPIDFDSFPRQIEQVLNGERIW